METMRISHTRTLLLLALISTASPAFCQDGKALQEAFASSYTAEKNEDYTKAIQSLKSVYNLNSYEINIRLGWLTYHAGKYTESLSYYTKAIGLSEKSIEARLGYVMPAAALGNWDQVRDQYLQIMKIDSRNSLVNYRLGLLFYNRKEYATAQNYVEMVVENYPFDYDSKVLLGWIQLRLGRNPEAVTLFNSVLLIRPADASALAGLKECNQ